VLTELSQCHTPLSKARKSICSECVSLSSFASVYMAEAEKRTFVVVQQGHEELKRRPPEHVRRHKLKQGTESEAVPLGLAASLLQVDGVVSAWLSSAHIACSQAEYQRVDCCLARSACTAADLL